MARTTATFGTTASVTVPFRVVHGLIVIPVSINGHGPMRMALDTGAPVMLIRDSVMAAGLDLRIAGRARVGGTGDGPALTAPLATGIAARIGAFSVTGVMGLVGVAADVLPAVDGVIGAAVFRHAVVEVDWDAGVVRLHDPTSSPPRAPGDTLALRIAPSLHAYVEGRVAMPDDTVTVELHLDTGARQGLTLAPSTVARFRTRPAPAVPTLVGFGSRGAASGTYIRAAAVRLGGTTIPGVPTAIPDQEPTNPARVGLPLLQRFNFEVDYPGQRVVLRPRTGVAEPLRFTTTGVTLAPGRDSSVRRVAHVVPMSPAARAGLAEGDSVVRVGSRALLALTEAEVAERLVFPATGAEIDLVVRRRATTRHLRMNAAVLLP
ncbi:MAG: aspartyl protease family protein [Gemmatimonadales bacterium]|nr:aspartyl protease family protein [Gemmatimonadales bacterium]